MRARAIAPGLVMLMRAFVWAVALLTAGALVPGRQLVAESISTLALVLLSCNLILSTRAPILEKRLEGLDKLFVTHRLIGLTVGVLVITHLSIVPKSVGYIASKPVGYTIAALGLLAWSYRETVFARVGPFRRCTVQQCRRLGDDVLELTLASEAGPYIRTPGQFVFASSAAGPSKEQHPFTISSGPGAEVRFSIKASGDFTDALVSGVPLDSGIRIEGPYGAFNFRRGRQRQVWLAGGIGITPFLAMAADLDVGREVTLIWSIRDRSEAVYSGELEALSRDASGLTVVIHPTSELGHLDLAPLPGSLRAAEDLSVFICGPLPMRREFIRQLGALGIPRSEIYFEEFRLR